jgi:hypothetical protein
MGMFPGVLEIARLDPTKTAINHDTIVTRRR